MPIYKMKSGNWKVKNTKFPRYGFRSRQAAIKQLQAIEASKQRRR